MQVHSHRRTSVGPPLKAHPTGRAILRMSLKVITELVDRVERVEEKYVKKQTDIVEDTWESRRDKVYAALNGISREMDLLDEAMTKRDSFEIPQIKHKIRKSHSIVRDVIRRMQNVQDKTIKKAQRKRGDKKVQLNKEVQNMQSDLASIRKALERSENDFHKKIGLGGSDELEKGGINSMNIELTNLMNSGNGDFGNVHDSSAGSSSSTGGATYNDELNKVDAYEEQVLEQVAKEQQELDNQLDQLEALMPVMKEMANVINENLDVTNQLAKDVTKKVQAADDKLSNVQGQIDEFQKEAKAANHLCYVIGFIILLGLAGVIYNLLRGSD